MFEKKTIKGIPKSQENLVENSKGYHVFGQNIYYQYSQRVLNDNKYLTEIEAGKPIIAYTSSTAQIGIINESFYRTGDNGAFQGLFPNFKDYNYNQIFFMLVAMKRKFIGLGYNTSMAHVIDLYIQLPTKNGEIDFEFMDAYISELEEERISELSAYLTVSGLDNYELSSEEKEALENLKLVQWEEKDVTGQEGIFNVKNTKNILSNDITPNSGSIPYLCASADNNSVSSYIEYKEELKDKGNCIFIGGKTFVVSYQETDFFSNDSHNLALYLKEEDKADVINQLFIATCIRKGLSHKYSWGNSISNKKIQNDKVMLPIRDGIINYKVMNIIISAVKKLVIKDVVLYADNKCHKRSDKQKLKI